MRTLILSLALLGLSASLVGCDSAMVDATIKPEITGKDTINSFPPERRSPPAGQGQPHGEVP